MKFNLLMSNKEEDNNEDDYIREADKPKIERLLPITTDYINNYNEELYLKQALAESLKNAEDEYIEFQLEQIKNEEELINQILQESRNDEITQEILKLSLFESKKEERYKSLENILYQFTKLRKIDINFNENLILLEEIMKKYINCEIDNYKITLDIYKNIFNQLQNIRIKENELNLIKNILHINLL